MTAVGVYAVSPGGMVRHLFMPDGVGDLIPDAQAACGLRRRGMVVTRSAGLPVCRRCTARSRPGELRA